mgnify:CR=1 FL=1
MNFEPTNNNENQLKYSFGIYWNQNLKNEFMVIDSRAEIDNFDSLEQKIEHLFDNEWKNKRPILIKNLHKNLNQSIWTPESFMNEFGHLCVNLVNCRNQRIINNLTMKTFWTGFQNIDGLNMFMILSFKIELF